VGTQKRTAATPLRDNSEFWLGPQVWRSPVVLRQFTSTVQVKKSDNLLKLVDILILMYNHHLVMDRGDKGTL